MNSEPIIEFIRKKNFLNLGPVGQGGLGKTILIRDETINEVFVCKKYSPIYEELIAQYFGYFIEEIKILHKLYHPNIVRVFNYYLYPEKTTGYILMEYIQGSNIDEYLYQNPEKFEDIFLQTIEGFKYLESMSILHRDIRPANILINDEGQVKIIDFGFGKFTNLALENKSISLNWRYSTPSEFDDSIYDNRTEVYFVGKLFEEILTSLGNVNFKYGALLNKMVQHKIENRIVNFFEVYRATISINAEEVEFNAKQKKIYLDFANQLINVTSKITRPIKMEVEISSVIKGLEDLYRDSMLEEKISNNHRPIEIFIKNQFKYWPKEEFTVSALKSFLDFFRGNPEHKQRIILNNLWERFQLVDTYTILYNDDDLPF